MFSKNYAEEEELLKNGQKMVELKNVTVLFDRLGVFQAFFFLSF